MLLPSEIELALQLYAITQLRYLITNKPAICSCEEPPTTNLCGPGRCRTQQIKQSNRCTSARRNAGMQFLHKHHGSKVLNRYSDSHFRGCHFFAGINTQIMRIRSSLGKIRSCDSDLPAGVKALVLMRGRRLALELSESKLELICAIGTLENRLLCLVSRQARNLNRATMCSHQQAAAASLGKGPPRSPAAATSAAATAAAAAVPRRAACTGSRSPSHRRGETRD